MSRTFQKEKDDDDDDKIPATLWSLIERGKKMKPSRALLKDSKRLPSINESKKFKETEASHRGHGKSEDHTERNHCLKLKESSSEESSSSHCKRDTILRKTISSSMYFQNCGSPIKNTGQSEAKCGSLASKVTRPTHYVSSFEVSNSDAIYRPVELYETKTEESKALKNWEKWMKIRKRQNQFFSEKLKKSKCKLAMNSGENLRQIKEEKDMLAYAQIPPADKWRGNPFRWKEKAKLPQRGMQSTYYLTETLFEKGVVPPLEFVGIPDVIKQEKDIYCDSGENFEKKSNWVNSDYRRQKREKYKRELLEIASHRIDEKDLIVLGKKITPKVEKETKPLVEVPLIEITPPEEFVCKSKSRDHLDAESEDDDEEIKFDSCQGIKSLAILEINGIELKMEDGEVFDRNCADEVCMSWFLTFEKAPIDSITETVLCVENKGSLAVRYEWQSWKPDKNFLMFPFKKTSGLQQFFFFDKNPGIFLPGQKTEIKFYHYAKNAGYHSETWRLGLSPNIFRCAKHGTVKLFAVAEETTLISDLLKIETYLDNLVKETIVQKIMEEIMERIRPEVPDDIEYPSLFMEEELFEFQNPFCHYRYDMVMELKDIFSQIPLDPPQEWDFSLSTLEELIRLYVKEKTQYSMLCRVMELTRLLLRPGYEWCRVNKKHKMLYNALCRIIDMMEDDAQRLETNFALFEKKNFIATDIEKSERSQVSSNISIDIDDEIKLEDKFSTEEMILDGTDSNERVYYKHALYTMIFHHLCEAVEQAAGILETCKLFEHHGELISRSSIENNLNQQIQPQLESQLNLV